jgi:hypothetical protein
MKFISHRGNLVGPNLELENTIDYVNFALKEGFEVEIDVWVAENRFFLGHDSPKQEIDISYLNNEKLWCHAKNIFALQQLLKMNTNCFWHFEDKFTLTSKGYVWAYPTVNYSNGVIAVLPEKYDGKNLFNCAGVCSDYILEYKTKIMIND